MTPNPLAPLSRAQLRSRRKRVVRARTINMVRFPKGELEIGRRLLPVVDDSGRPQTRGDCADGPRPCPWISCAHHLYLDVDTQRGSIKLNFPDVDPEDLEQLRETCALDVADHGGVTLEEAGEFLNVTRERVRQIDAKALERLARRARIMGLDLAELLVEEPMRHDEALDPSAEHGRPGVSKPERPTFRGGSAWELRGEEDLDDDGPYPCPGCQSFGACAPGCIDDAIRRGRDDDEDEEDA